MPIPNKIGFHWIPYHKSRDHMEMVVRMNTLLKILDGDPRLIQEVLDRTTAPIILRSWPMSDNGGSVYQQMIRDPDGLGRQHAEDWYTDLRRTGLYTERDRLLFEGVNEPPIWDPGFIQATIRYNVSFVETCAYYDLRPVAMNLSVGWPGNGGVKDAPPRYDVFEEVIQALLRVDGVWGTHEYYHPLVGPQAHWGWLCGRFTWLAKMVPELKIAITEFGGEAAVAGPVPDDKRGWEAYIKAEQYIDQIHWYNGAIAAYPQVLGASLFPFDYASNHWASQDVSKIGWQIVEYARSVSFPDDIQPPPGPADNWDPQRPGGQPEEPPSDPPPYELVDVLRKEAPRTQSIYTNRDAALQKTMVANVHAPIGNEFQVVWDGSHYAAQLAEHLPTGKKYVYYAKVGDWGNVFHVPL